MEKDYQLLLSTCPTMDVAKKLARALVEKHLAACVNIVPHLESVFEWQNEIVTESETLLLIKTHGEHYAAIEQLLLQQHPYEVPELIALPIEKGLPRYLAWIDQMVAYRHS